MAMKVLLVSYTWGPLQAGNGLRSALSWPLELHTLMNCTSECQILALAHYYITTQHKYIQVTRLVYKTVYVLCTLIIHYTY